MAPSVVAKEVIQEHGSPHCDHVVEEEGVGREVLKRFRVEDMLVVHHNFQPEIPVTQG